MAKEVKKKRTRKKVPKKTKEKKKKISKKKVKVLGKEIKLKIKVPEQTKKIHEISEPLTQLEGFLSEVKAPVLERVVTTETNFDQGSSRETPRNLRDNQEGSNFEYKSNGGGYFQSNEGSKVSEGGGFQYTERPSAYTEAPTTEDEDKIEETRRLTGRGDQSQMRESNKFGERQTFVEQDRETKKYMGRGDDYK